MKGIILLANNFEDAEAIVTIDLLKRAGIFVDTVSMYDSSLVKSKYGLNLACDKLIKDVKESDYDFLIIPGGAAVMFHLENEDTLNTVKLFENSKKLIAAICAAPSILGKLGLLDNEEFVCFPSFETYMPKGIYKEHKKAVTCNNHITSKAAGTVFNFAYEIIKYLISEDKAKQVFEEVYY